MRLPIGVLVAFQGRTVKPREDFGKFAHINRLKFQAMMEAEVAVQQVLSEVEDVFRWPKQWKAPEIHVYYNPLI